MLQSELDEHKVQYDFIDSLEEGNKCCENCNALELKFEGLNKTFAYFTQSSNNLGYIINRQRNAYDRKGLGYVYKPRPNNNNFFMPPKAHFRNLLKLILEITLHVSIVENMGILHLHVLLESMEYLVKNMFGLERDLPYSLTLKDPNHFGYLKNFSKL